MTRVEVAVTVARPPDEAFAWLSNFEIIDYEPNRRVEFRTVSGTFPVHIERWVEPAHEGAVIHALIRGDASGLYKLAAPVLDLMTQRQIEGDYAQLKQLLENQAAEMSDK